MITALAAAGVFFAVPLVGRLVVGTLQLPVPAIARPSLWVAAGVAIWSVPLLGSLVLGAYRPEVIGVAGWLTVAVLIVAGKVGRPRIPRLSRADRWALTGILLAALLTAAFPADPFTTGLDMGTYASHAVYMVHHGQLDVPYPWPSTDVAPAGFSGYPGVFFTQPTLTVQFGHLFPAWLAQAFATFGYEGLVRLNAVVGVFSLLAIYGLAKRFMTARVAVLAIAFLAFNPSQIWIAKQTLTETLTQLFIWCGLLLLTAYFARGFPRWGVWAGILLGISALVRVDAFLLVPFLIIGHAMWTILARQSARRTLPSWKYVYLGALPVFGAALAYYVAFSRPYLDLVTTQMLQIGGLILVGTVALGLTRLAPVASLTRMALSRRAIVLAILAVLTGLTAYAYFVRPIVPPFAVFSAPGELYDGERTYIEYALPNLGRYLTPGVIWGALVGWSLLFVAACRGSRSIVLAPLLVVTLGATAVYAWDQSHFPSHFWAIRRFVPVIIPALVLFAGFAAGLLLRRLSMPGRRLAVGLTVSLLAIFTLLIGAPTYTVQERQGSYAALGKFARSVPANGYVLALDGDYEAVNFWMPLYLAFDRPIIPLDVASQEGRAEAIERLRGASWDKPVTIVTAAHEFRMDAVEGPRIAVPWSRVVIDERVLPVPSTTHVEDVTLTMIEGTGIDTIGVGFGARPQWLAAVSGFHRPQLIDGRPLRWTDGAGRISIPIEGDRHPTRLAINVADTGPDGGPLRIAINGVTLFAGVVPAGAWSAEYDLDGIVDLRQGDIADVEIISDTFEGEPVDRVDRETRFGVQVETVTFLADG